MSSTKIAPNLYVIQRGPTSWQVRDRDLRKGGFGSLAEAHAFAAARLAMRSGAPAPVEPRPVSPRDLMPRTIAELFARFAVIEQQALEATTRETYNSILRNQILPFFGDLELATLDDEQVVAAFASMECSQWTKVHVRTRLVSALRWASKKGWCGKDILDDVRVGSRPETTGRALTDDERTKLLAYFTPERRFSLLTWLCISTGLRRGEALGLRWRNVEFLQDGSARVRVDETSIEAIIRDKAGNREGRRLVHKAGGKSAAARRVVEVPARVATMLREAREQAAHEADIMQINVADLHVLRDQHGKPYWPTYVSKEWPVQVRRDLGIDVSLHDLRHTYATLLISKGVPLKLVSERLGHANVLVTQSIYQHVRAEDHFRVAEIAASIVGD